MVKISELKVEQLKQLLRDRNLASTGNKNELIQRLTADIGTDEIEMEIPETNVQQQIDELRKMMQQLTTSINRNVSDAGRSSAPETLPVRENIVAPESFDLVNRSSYSVREIAETIPEFNPTDDGSLSAEQFVDRVNAAMSAYRWEEKSLILAVYSRLKGSAKLWMDGLVHMYSNWQELSANLIEEFGVRLNEAEMHRKLSSTQRDQNEGLLDYCFRIAALGRKFQLSDQAIIQYTRDGLKHRDLQVATAATRFSSLREMRETFSEYLPNMPSKSNVTQTYGAKGDLEGPKIKLESLKSVGKAEKCYNCFDEGHFASDCPKPQRRSRCVDCQKVHRRNEPQNCGKPVQNVRSVATQDFFVRKIYLNGVQLEAFIDTGKGICGGVRRLDHFIEAELEVDDVKVQTIFYIADDTLLSADVLIGQNMFVQKNVRGVVGDGHFRFENNNINQIETPKFDMCVGDVKSETKSALVGLINLFEDIFARDLSQIGKTDIIELKIELDTDKPIAQAPYRVPEPKKRIISEMIQDLLKNDIIEPSESEYASPVVLVKKRNGQERFCVDYRKLNSHMCKQIYPMLNIEERLQEAIQHKLFSTLDLNSGYYQIPIEPQSRKYTAFVTTDGIYQFKRMPFGLKNAPVAFQRLVTRVKDATQPGDMIHYMDDILLGAENEPEMINKLTRVFEVIRKFKLTLNPQKCEFFKRNVTFLGHQLNQDGVKPGSVKVSAIRNFRTPENITDVRRFLGLSGYFRKFVPGYAVISEPLRRLLRKGESFSWGVEQQTSFEELKNTLTSEPVLAAYDLNAQHQLHTDASSIGIAAVLLQNSDGYWKPVAYYSQSTTHTERKMHSYELETLAVVEGLERFKYYVCGKPVKVVTDCTAVKTAMNKKELIPRIARWWLRIQEFDIEIEHRSEQYMCHADALSRTPNEAPHEVEPATLKIDKVEIDPGDWLVSMQLQDQKLQEMVKMLVAKDKNIQKTFLMDQGRLCKLQNGRKLWVVPKSLRFRVTQDAHEKNGHLSADRTVEKIQQLMWFPRMRNFVKSFVKSCIDCSYNKQLGGTKEGEYHFSDIEPVPFRTVHIDHLGPFPRSSKRNEYILVLVDAFSKYTVIRAVPSTATRYVTKVLDEVSAYFGMPRWIISDRGTAFTSKEFQKYCVEFGLKHVLNAVRTPRANGQVERVNRTILSMLLPSTKLDSRWDGELRNIQWAINSLKSSTTGCSPHELLFGFRPRDILGNKLVTILQDNYQNANSHEERLNELEVKRKDAAHNIASYRRKAKERYDKMHVTPRRYSVGDLVLVGNEAPSIGTSRKLEPRFKGPFQITKVLHKDRYVVEDLPCSNRKQRHYCSVYASDGLKPWCSLPPIDDEDDDVTSYLSEDAE